MTIQTKLSQGTTAWFDMVGRLMEEFATRANLPNDLNMSLVERYTDGAEIGDGLVQGIHFDIAGGRPSFRVGAGRDERADVTLEITRTLARELNALRSDDPAYAAARQRAISTGAMRIDGDPSRLGGWLDAVHDPIVDRTI